MKSYFPRVALLAAAFVLFTLAARADFSDRMDMVHRGMSARSAVAILGQPSKVTQGPGGSLYFNYLTPGGVWQLAVRSGRVIAIQEP
jgi:hypothetical protein